MNLQDSVEFMSTYLNKNNIFSSISPLKIPLKELQYTFMRAYDFINAIEY